MNRKKQWKRIWIAIPVVLLIGVIIFFENHSNEEKKFSKQYLDIFDTVTVITGYAKSEDEFLKQSEALHQELNFYHQLFDIYHTYVGMNNLMSINEKCPSESLSVDQKMMDFLTYCKEMEEETNGQTNIALGSVLQIWHQYREDGLKNPKEAKLPSLKELQDAGTHTNIDQLVLNEQDLTVKFSDEKLRLDVGGIAKGYAVEKVAQYAKKKGWDHLLLNVGGNIRAVGAKPDQSKWTIGIQDPFGESEDAYLQTFQIKEGSMVTSGNYQRYYVVDGKKYCHIIDPKTLYPAEYIAAVTIQCEDSGLADSYSTAFFNMSLDEGKAFAKKHPQIEVLWVTNDGKVTMTDGFGE